VWPAFFTTAITLSRLTSWPAGLQVQRVRQEQALHQQAFAQLQEQVRVRGQARRPPVSFRMQQHRAPESWRREETFAYFCFLRQKIEVIVSCRFAFLKRFVPKKLANDKRSILPLPFAAGSRQVMDS
jgi:hypothetical protein